MRARLTVETGAATPPTCELPPTQPVRLGRNKENNIVVKDEHASRWHAEVFAERGRWYIREVKATNGTRVNGQRIHDVTELAHGAEIGIGAARIRFSLDPSLEGTAEMPVVGNPTPVEQPILVPAAASDLHPTLLQADDLTVLLAFMNEAMSDDSPYALVKRALTTVHQQTGAGVCGFLGLDPQDPLPRLTIPDQAPVDVSLSRRLTKRAEKTSCTAWLGADDRPGLESDSLAAYQDAVCVPLRANAEAEYGSTREPAFGALHAYRCDRLFAVREVRFIEAMANCLANNLRLLRSRRALEADNSRLRKRSRQPDHEMVGVSDVIEQVRELVRRNAAGLYPVLILGESGVGKELVAEGLHLSSARHNGPMIAVNCATIPAGIAEAELFGNCEGAYTGASVARDGYFQQADDGTLFLDEVGELSLDNQARLLRVLDKKLVRPVGGQSEIKVDVRIIAATNRDLEKWVREGKFRKDLYFRLAAAQIKIPALRERAEDIPVLAQHFLEQFNGEYRHRAHLSEAASQRLRTYSWPGNVRQLRSMMETAVAMTPDGPIHAGDLHLVSEECSPEGGPESLNLEALEAWAIRQALERTNWNNTHAAETLGIHRETLINKIRKYRIEKPS
jgi:Nif-specific regulatory protein